MRPGWATLMFRRSVAGHFEFERHDGQPASLRSLAATAHAVSLRPAAVRARQGSRLEVFIRAMGGAYVYLEKGKPTGWAPFELADTPDNREFLYGSSNCAAAKTVSTIRASRSRLI